MWNNINLRHLTQHAAESLRETPGNQQENRPSEATNPPPVPQPMQPDIPEDLRLRALQHRAREESQGRSRAEEAETRTAQGNPQNASGARAGLPPRPNRTVPYQEDRALVERFVEGALAGDSNHGTASAYKSRMLRFSAWLRLNKLPGMQARLFSDELTDLAARYGRIIQDSDIPICLQHMRTMESNKFGTVHIPRVERHRVGQIPDEDHWLIESAFTKNARSNYDYKGILRTFSDWLNKRNNTLCNALGSDSLKKLMDDFIQEHPHYGFKITPAITHMKNFDGGHEVVIKQNRDSKDLPEEDQRLIDRFRDVEYQRLEDQASKSGKKLTLHKESNSIRPKRSAADKYATSLRSFCGWRQAQKDITGSLTSILHNPVLDSQMEIYTANMHKSYFRSLRAIVRRLQAAFPPGTERLSPERQSPRLDLSASDTAAGNRILNTHLANTTTSAQQHALTRQSASFTQPASNHLLSPRRNGPAAQQPGTPDSVFGGLSPLGPDMREFDLNTPHREVMQSARNHAATPNSPSSRFPSLNSSTWCSLREFDAPTPQSTFRPLAPSQADPLPQQNIRTLAQQPGTPDSVFEGLSPLSTDMREFDLNTPLDEMMQPAQNHAAIPDSPSSRFPSLNSSTWRSLREFDAPTPQSAFRPQAPSQADPLLRQNIRTLAQQPGTPDSVFEGLSPLGPGMREFDLNTPHDEVMQPAQNHAATPDSPLSRFPSLDSATWRSLREFDITSQQSLLRQPATPVQSHRPPATPDSIFGALSPLSSLSDTEMPE